MLSHFLVDGMCLSQHKAWSGQWGEWTVRLLSPPLTKAVLLEGGALARALGVVLGS